MAEYPHPSHSWASSLCVRCRHYFAQHRGNPPPNPSPLSEAGGRALQFCHLVGCVRQYGVAAEPRFQNLRVSQFRHLKISKLQCHPEVGVLCPPKDLCTRMQRRRGRRMHRSFGAKERRLRMTEILEVLHFFVCRICSPNLFAE